MTKALLAVIAALTFTAAAQAAILDITPHIGYTSVNMLGVNHSNLTQWGWEGNDHVSEINSAMLLGLDVTTPRLTHVDWLTWGVRGEFLQTNLGVNDGRTSNATYNTDQGTLTNLLVGATASQPFIFENLQMGLGAWVGAGYGTMEQQESAQYHTTAPSDIQTGLFTGYTLVGELESSVTYKLASHLSLAFVGGWRWADFASLSDSSKTPLYDNLQRWEYNRNNPVNVDFSGATAQGSVSYSF